MRTSHLFYLASVAACSLSGLASAQNVEMRDSPSAEEITEKFIQASRQNNKVEVQRAKETPDPSKAATPGNIVDESDFLSFNGRSTLVPKGAILHIPPALKDRIKFTPGNPLLPWGDFFAVNRAWITTVEVSRIQAEGNQALAEETTKSISKSTSLIVATYKTGPISVLPLKTPPPVDPKADPKAAAAAKTQTASTSTQKKP